VSYRHFGLTGFTGFEEGMKSTSPDVVERIPELREDPGLRSEPGYVIDW
jgi:hypothetical protein